jgi:hypothetical protein
MTTIGFLPPPRSESAVEFFERYVFAEKTDPFELLVADES